METIVGIIVYLIIYGLIQAFINASLDNYDMSNVDTVKLSSDVAKGVSVAERRIRCINGYYDKK